MSFILPLSKLVSTYKNDEIVANDEQKFSALSSLERKQKILRFSHVNNISLNNKKSDHFEDEPSEFPSEKMKIEMINFSDSFQT